MNILLHQIRSTCNSYLYSRISSTLIAQCIGFLLLTLLLRKANTAAYGGFSIFLLISNLSSTVFTLRLETSFHLCRDLSAIHKLALKSLIVSLILSFAFSVLFSLSITTFAQIYASANIPQSFIPSRSLLANLSLSFFAFYSASMVSILYNAHLALENTSVVNIYRCLQSTLVYLAQLLFLQLTPGSFSEVGLLISAYDLSILTTGIYLLCNFFQSTSFTPCTISTFRNTLSLILELLVNNHPRVLMRRAHKYRKLLTGSLPADILNQLTQLIIAITISSKFTLSFFGSYALSMRVLSLPLTLLATPILEQFRTEAVAEIKKLRNFNTSFHKYSRFLLLLSFLFVLPFGLALSFFIKLSFFGPQWSSYYIIPIILLPLVISRFISSTLSYSLIISEQRHADLAWQISLFALALGYSLLATRNQFASLLVYSFFYTLMYFLLYLISSSSSRRPLVSDFNSV